MMICFWAHLYFICTWKEGVSKLLCLWRFKPFGFFFLFYAPFATVNKQIVFHMCSPGEWNQLAWTSKCRKWEPVWWVLLFRFGDQLLRGPCRIAASDPHPTHKAAESLSWLQVLAIDFSLQVCSPTWRLSTWLTSSMRIHFSRLNILISIQRI